MLLKGVGTGQLLSSSTFSINPQHRLSKIFSVFITVLLFPFVTPLSFGGKPYLVYVYYYTMFLNNFLLLFLSGKAFFNFAQ
jgi:hypothetical protein